MQRPEIPELGKVNGGRAWKGSPAEGARDGEAPGGDNDRCDTGGSAGNGGRHCGATSYGRIIEYPALGGTHKDRRENAPVVHAFALKNIYISIYLYIYIYRNYCGGGFGGGSGELYAMCRPPLGRGQALSSLIPRLTTRHRGSPSPHPQRSPSGAILLLSP